MSSPELKGIPLRLRAVVTHMLDVAVDMEYIGGFGELGDKGREMIGAAGLARQWADHIEAELIEAQS